tara:strand:+ start:529 stop:1134 length:606 start_codon:yes stop_codon:yes gene_type:complete
MIICPIGMIVVFAGVEPAIMGEADESLPAPDRILSTLDAFTEKELAGNVINLVGLLFMIGWLSALAILGKELKENGAALGSVASLVFTAVLAILAVSLGLSLGANDLFAEGNKAAAVTLELASESAWYGFPQLLGVGYTLLGLGLVLERNPLPRVLAGLFVLAGVATFILAPINDGLGFLLFLISILLVITSGIFLLRQGN